MDINAQGAQLLQKLSEALALEEPLVFDENGVCFLVLDEKTPLILELNEALEAIIVNLILGKLAADRRAEILERLMKANYYWSQTEGATVGLDEETELVSLFYRFSLPMRREEDFTDQLEQMVNVGEYWAGELSLGGVDLDSDGISLMNNNLKA